IALEIDSTSIPIAEVHIANMSKISLVIGAESTGVTPEALEQCAVIAHIPMHGINSSMNVAQAAGIALYELTR
ncbi:TrmH family RNA methyltransferase, partial [Dokdonia donghaensis]